jgi:phosphoglycerate dehydrogenase-like enzyme/glyoxylase-like metal-dependent hydrolase (beta-lactamase superfamily II)
MRTAIAVVLLILVAAPLHAADELPQMKFNEVKEIAPGVFFRYSSISATDDKVPFGGSNNIWVVLEDYVVVIDANFPKEAGDVIDAIKKTTDKPIRYVFDTHHHGDHAYGNAVFAKAGASVVAQSACARLLRVNGPKEFADAGKGPMGRKDVAESHLKVPDLVFNDRLVLDDGKQRIEFRFFGHGHTAGDASAYLPKHKILCTGDACVNGAYNFMGHSDSASWIRALEKMQQLDVKMVCPGHGPIAGKDLLETQKRYFVELRREVQKAIDAGKTGEEIAKTIDLPWYKEWTGVKPTGPNVQHVYDELTGRVAPWDFSEDFGIFEGPSPTKETAGWTKPKRIIVPSGLMPAKLAELKRVAPEVEFAPARTVDEALKEASEADAVVGFWSPELAKTGAKLRWIQMPGATPDGATGKELGERKLVLTSTRNAEGPMAADRAFGLLLQLSKKSELHGKTLLLIGLGGAGEQIARRARAFGMRVEAVDPSQKNRPEYVFSLGGLDKLPELLSRADAVVLACPLTPQTKGLIGSKQLKAMKKTAFLIDVGRGGLVELNDLAEALKSGVLAGAGLALTDPTPLPQDHPLRKLENVVVAAAPTSPETAEREWRLLRENVRRFAAGERLLCVVDKARGY